MTDLLSDIYEHQAANGYHIYVCLDAWRYRCSYLSTHSRDHLAVELEAQERLTILAHQI